MAATSMMYTMGMALDRAAEGGVGVSILVQGSWVDGHVAAADGTGVVLETHDGHHTVVRVDRIAAVRVHAESPLPTAVAHLPAQQAEHARPLPGHVPGPRSA